MNLLLHSRIIQPKLMVGQPDDPYEREADRVADQVMRMGEPQFDLTLRYIQPTIQRICTGCKDEVQRQSIMTLRRSPAQISRKCAKCEEKAALPSNELKEKNVLVRAKRESVNPSEASSDLRSYLASSRGGGQRLSDSTRAYFEPRFGRDFGHVRVHTDSRAHQASDEIGARAFTSGSNVYFARGQYQPGSSTGDRLLGHELMHVVQQGFATENTMQKLQRQPTPTAPEERESDSDEALCEVAEFPPAAVWFSDPMLARIRAHKALMAFGSNGEPVALVQQALVAWGCDEGLGNVLPKFGVDGLFRSETRAAVKTFQGRQGIKDDGIVGPITMGELDRFIPGGLPPCPAETEPAAFVGESGATQTACVPPLVKKPGPRTPCERDCQFDFLECLEKSSNPQKCLAELSVCLRACATAKPAFEVCARPLQGKLGLFANHAYIETPTQRFAIITRCKPTTGSDNVITGTAATKTDISPDPCDLRPSCVNCVPLPGVTNLETCFRDAFNAYADPSLYKNNIFTGDFINSNTFAGTLARACCDHMIPQPPALGNVPGWNSSPAPPRAAKCPGGPPRC